MILTQKKYRINNYGKQTRGGLNEIFNLGNDTP